MNKRLPLISLVLFWTAAIMVPAYGQADPVSFEARLLSEIGTAATDSLKIEKLFELGSFRLNYLDDARGADSLGEIAIAIAETGHRPELRTLAYHRYIQSNDLHEFYGKALDYARTAEQLSMTENDPAITFQACSDLTAVYLAGYQYEKALDYSYRSLAIATTGDDVIGKAESYLAIGQSLEGKNQKIDAFRNYISAVSLGEITNNRELLMTCYSRLSAFYNLNKLYSKATRYKLMERDLVEKFTPVDSLALMWIEFDLQVIDFNSNHNRINEKSILSVIGFAKRTGHRRLLNYTITLFRSQLIESNNISRLKDFYQHQFPDEWQRLETDDSAMHFRLKALFFEASSHVDSAFINFAKAEVALQDGPNKILLSKFYNRYGQFLLRHGFNDKALDKFNKSYEMAKAASYFEYMLLATVQMESIYAHSGNFKDAYRYAVLNKSLSDSVNDLSRKDQILMLEIDHETRQQERLTEREKGETSRRHYLQYTAITIGIITVFIILIMLGSLKVPEWIIRMLGFFSFIFLFEFIILIADHKIHEMTHDEPWKILLIKIFLIAILLPLHHGIEKRVITYLLNHKLLNIHKFSLVGRIRDARKKASQKEEKEES